MTLKEVEIQVWRKWTRQDNKFNYGFIPASYDDERAGNMEFGLLITPDNRTFKIGFKVFKEDEKINLQIVDEIYEIKHISLNSPVTMRLIDSHNNEILFVENNW